MMYYRKNEDAPCASERDACGASCVFKLRQTPIENRKLRITVVRIREAPRF